MQIIETGAGGRPLVEAYGPGGFRIDGRRTEGSVLILPDQAIDWSVFRFEDLTLDSFAPVIEVAQQVEILLLGCGPATQLPDRAMRDGLRGHGISLEPMDTGAACRTFNVLVAEARPVAAALIAL